MVRRSCLPLVLLGTVLAIQAGNAAFAQDTERYERYFRALDRNNNGEIDPDEFRRLRDSTRERMLQMGISGNTTLKQQEFVAGMAGAEEIRQKEQELERERERTSSSSSNSNNNSSSSSSSSRGSDSRSSRGKRRITFSLPSAYLPHDKNGDGQISLAEWDRAKLADFRKLDRNGDGFLAPVELVHPGPEAISVTPPAVAKPGGAPSTATSTVAVKPGVPAAGATPAPAEDPLVRQAKFYFTTVDKDKDGQISTEEWAASRGARPMFEKASVMPSLPMTEAAFNEHFVKIKQSQQ